MTPTFEQNMDFFRSLKLARECMLSLSMHCVVVERIRMLPSGVVVEIDRPLDIDIEPTISEKFASFPLLGCTVAWQIKDKPHD